MTTFRRTACLLLALAVLGGCTTTRGWRYRPGAPHPRSEPVVDASVVIVPFDDARVEELSNTGLLCLVPLALYGTAEIQGLPGDAFPETQALDFSLALTQEVDNFRLFREAFLGRRASEADYAITGTIVSSRIRLRVWTWGLSFVGLLIDVFGAPMFSTWGELVIDLRLVDNATGEVVATHRVDQSDSRWGWIWTGTGGIPYDEFLKEEYGEFVFELEDVLRERRS